jgi:hypothetical protein
MRLREPTNPAAGPSSGSPPLIGALLPTRPEQRISSGPVVRTTGKTPFSSPRATFCRRTTLQRSFALARQCKQLEPALRQNENLAVATTNNEADLQQVNL